MTPCAIVCGTDFAIPFRMNHLVANFVGWLASALFVATVTVVWGVAAALVWITGNGSLAERH